MRLEDNDDILHLCEPKVALFMTCPLRRLVVQQLHGHRNLEWVGENAFAVAVPVTWLQYSLKCAGLQGRQYEHLTADFVKTRASRTLRKDLHGGPSACHRRRRHQQPAENPLAARPAKWGRFFTGGKLLPSNGGTYSLPMVEQEHLGTTLIWDVQDSCRQASPKARHTRRTSCIADP